MFHLVGFVGNAYETAVLCKDLLVSLAMPTKSLSLHRYVLVSLAMPTKCQLSGLIMCVACINKAFVLCSSITTRIVAATSFPFFGTMVWFCWFQVACQMLKVALTL